MNFTSSLNFTVTERFLRYVTIDTQSDPSSVSFPSTEKQKDLARLLVDELLDIGVADAHMDEYGYVYATIPSNTNKQVPVICFCSHMDTAPDCSGKNVKPIVHKNYQGQDIILPDDASQIIKQAEHPDLKNQIGNDVITASGTTLLGADNKAGVAEIMDACYQLMNRPEIKHGDIRILFTPDEEVGHGVEHVDITKLGAYAGYTMDGESAGNMENETFSADGARLTINGVSSHPGFAKGKMESAIKIAGEIIAALPDSLSPEHTEGMQGFVHPVAIEGHVETVGIDFIIRDFDAKKLSDHADVICKTADEVLKKYPASTYNLAVSEQYRNMKNVLDEHPEIVEYAMEAINRTGIAAKLCSIRGGTDGSRLSFMGLPCPNIFAGEHAFHSKQEWVSVQDMQKAVETILHLCMIWEEKS
ncbi:peptidase T. Metallo peptidase. MEROPS family M20B [Mucilaginibacter lappiensis]|uniref:Peptidase T n=1 Tax=Mucilaginibacter lappiensis TaxID=354630 RepID=A0ABR6PRC5_9SPHI|nr:peptidase T [Mucilaginibacter lappiensis]MBB6111734.1 tripeptide aminopeptidase [Mucilaginibacter lappiensis]SIR86798.1 peptidase T. Metallo peptidase. MEROPS family M20B [Mucilaginibacter lappiensis]